MAICLNIGCHQLYKPGYINIDESNKTVADTISLTYELPYKDNSVDLIESYNLLEQLSYEKAQLSLEEWYRVLKEDGKLILETTNIELLIDEYKKSEDPEEKDRALKLLYEDSNEKFKHISGFYFGKIRRDLLKIGFDNIEEVPPKLKSYKEVLRVECRKTTNTIDNMIKIRTKKEALKELDCVDLENTKILKEFNEVIIESLISAILSKMTETALIKNENFHKLIAYSPKLSKIFLKECYNCRLIDERQVKYMNFILDLLIKHNIIWTTYNNIIEKEKEPGYSINYYIDLLEKNAVFLSKMINSPDTNKEKHIFDYISSIKSPVKTMSVELSSDIFSYELLKEKASHIEQLATKLFANSDYEEASIQYSNALKLHPELALSYINKGLLEIILQNTKGALKLFKYALELVEKDKNNDIIMLNIAMCQLYLNNYNETIRSLNNLKEDSAKKFQALGTAYYYIERYEEAIEAYSWATILQVQPKTFLNLALAQTRLNLKQDAAKSFSKAKKLDPEVTMPREPVMPKFRTVPYSQDEL